MNYSVDWTPAARATLATIWIGAVDRQAVTLAQARMDRLLAVDPLRNGAPLSEGGYTPLKSTRCERCLKLTRPGDL